MPKFSDITQPLRELTKKNVRFKWTEKEDVAFKKVKEILTSDTVMTYFDKKKQTELVTDASPWGLSAILSQHTPGKDDRRIVAYVSRSLSSAEQWYSQTKREALAIVWAVERLHIYLYGDHFILHTDCKPIELILNNEKSKTPAHIERWNLRLQDYNFSALHTKGADNPSDFLSRHPSPEIVEKQERIAEDYIKFLSTHAVPKAMSLVEIQQMTKVDCTLQKLANLIRSDDWTSVEEEDEGVNIAELKAFSRIRDELTVNEEADIILRGNRIVMPLSLQ